MLSHILSHSKITTLRLINNNNNYLTNQLDIISKMIQMYNLPIKTIQIVNYNISLLELILSKPEFQNIKIEIIITSSIEFNKIKSYQKIYQNLIVYYQTNLPPEIIETHNIIYQGYLTPYNIKAWQDYIKLWITKYHIPQFIIDQSANWTDETLESYKDFLKILFKYQLSKYKKNFFYNTINLIQFKNYQIQKYTSTMTILLSNLTIIPYDDITPVILGKISFNGEIIDNNSIIAIPLWDQELLNNTSKCATCQLKNICAHPNLEASFNRYAELFIPVESICKLEQVRLLTLYNLYKKAKLIKQNILTKDELKYFDNIVLQLK